MPASVRWRPLSCVACGHRDGSAVHQTPMSPNRTTASRNATLWGIDLGGTKIEGAILAADQHGDARHRLRVPTEGTRGYDHVVRQVRTLVEQLEKASGLKRPAVIG